MYVCDWICKRGLIRAIINIQKYDFEMFNSIYLENDWTCFSTNLQLFKLIHCILLYTRQPAGFPTILDSFLLVQPISLALLQGRRVGGRWVATKWQAKATSSLKQGNDYHFCHFHLHMSHKLAKLAVTYTVGSYIYMCMGKVLETSWPFYSQLLIS